MSKAKPKSGTFVRIRLADGSFAYGRLLESPFAAFYQYRTLTPDDGLDEIASRPILLKMAVRHLAVAEWDVIGWRALDAALAQPVVQFMQDLGDFRRCTIFDTAGYERDVEPHECVGLERAAVWEKEATEERLLDALLGRPNADEERLKVRLQ